MTSRAGATIASLVLIVVSATAALIPAQGPQLLGAEILLFTTGTLVLTIDAGVRMIRAAVPPYVTGTWIKSILAFLAIVPFRLRQQPFMVEPRDGSPGCKLAVFALRGRGHNTGAVNFHQRFRGPRPLRHRLPRGGSTKRAIPGGDQIPGSDLHPRSNVRPVV